MKYLRLSLISFFSLFLFSPSWALEITSAPTLVSSSDTSLSIDWEDVPDAIGYYLYYDTTTGETWGYSDGWIDLIDVSEYTIEWLQPDTEYFVGLTAVDLEWNESLFSPEAAFRTTWEVSAGPSGQEFALDDVTPTAIDTLTLSFNSELDTSPGAEREFLILNSITEEEVFVTAAEVDPQDPSKLIVVLDRDLIPEDAYNFTIISLADASGRNIESWIDGLTKFDVPAEFPSDEPELNAAWDQSEQEPQEEEQEQESTPPANTGWGNGGQVISNEDMGKNTEVAAEKTEKLPQTWPEHILLLLLALFLGMSFLIYQKIKKA